jgi:hypothetical protein
MDAISEDTVGLMAPKGAGRLASVLPPAGPGGII